MDLLKYNLIDLTHSLSSEIAQWTDGCGFEHQIKCDYADTLSTVKFRTYDIKMHAGTGTHMDAPSHCIENGLSIADIPLQKLLMPCVVIDVSKSAHEKFIVTSMDIVAFENNHGHILSNTFVFIYTGWSQYWHNPKKYRNNLIFPSVSREAAELLLERDVCGLGIDTLSPDCLNSGFPVHQIFLGAGKYIIENIANLEKLSITGAYSLALPMKIANGTEAPVRLIAFMM